MEDKHVEELNKSYAAVRLFIEDLKIIPKLSGSINIGAYDIEYKIRRWNKDRVLEASFEIEDWGPIGHFKRMKKILQMVWEDIYPTIISPDKIFIFPDGSIPSINRE